MSLIETMIHAAVGVSAIFASSKLSLISSFESAKKLALDEQISSLCGSIAAGEKNFSDTIATQPSSDQESLNQTKIQLLNSIRARTNNQTRGNIISCQVSSKFQTYTFKPYQLDHQDSPTRKVNWSYRLVTL
jgi:hypothetical protein